LNKKAKVAEKEVQQMEKQLEELRENRNTAKRTVDDLETELQEFKKQLNSLLEQGRNTYKKITTLEAEIDQLRMRRHELYQRCKLQQIKLPLVGQPTEEEEEESASSSSRAGQAPSLPVEFPSGEMELESQVVGEIAAREDEFEIDFSGLDANLKKIRQTEDEQRKVAEFQEQLASIAAAMQKLAPNLKAIDQFDSVSSRLQETEKEFEAARANAKEIAEKFAAKKQERYDRFMKAFNHISENIDTIYKNLTKSASHPGGTAFLTLENQDEPYLYGINYNVNPPGKRFRDMEQLSGGEKTVAALALLFAINSYKPSPFFVLDEIDAALDNNNIAKVVRYIKKRVAEDNLQCIVISLKDTFYSKTDALIGIFRDQDLDCSGTVTLNLADYPDVAAHHSVSRSVAETTTA
jgi:structural maintenance of chromosome 1